MSYYWCLSYDIWFFSLVFLLLAYKEMFSYVFIFKRIKSDLLMFYPAIWRIDSFLSFSEQLASYLDIIIEKSIYFSLICFCSFFLVPGIELKTLCLSGRCLWHWTKCLAVIDLRCAFYWMLSFHILLDLFLLFSVVSHWSLLIHIN